LSDSFFLTVPLTNFYVKKNPRGFKTNVRDFRGEFSLREHLIRAEAQVKAMEEASEEEMALRIKKGEERAVRERKERLSHALDQLGKIRSQKKST
jgi:hypothetical protein